MRPVSYHDRVAPAERRAMLRWFYLGGAGFAITVLGCVGIVAGVLLQLLRARAVIFA